MNQMICGYFQKGFNSLKNTWMMSFISHMLKHVTQGQFIKTKNQFVKHGGK